jgi:pentatricopeptide repeat protein
LGPQLLQQSSVKKYLYLHFCLNLTTKNQHQLLSYEVQLGSMYKIIPSSETMHKKAMLLLTDIHKHGVNPGVIQYGIVIEVLCRVGRMEDVVSQLKQMIHEGGHPNSLCYAYLVSICKSTLQSD